MDPGLALAGAGCWLVCLLAYFLGYRSSARRYDAIVEVPTIAAKDIPGLGAAMVEVKGDVEADQPLVSDLARVPCAAFDCSVTEHWTTTRTETDSKGNTRTVTEDHSETRYSNEGQIDFRVRDSSGCATVRPAGASMDMIDSMDGLDEPVPDSPAAGITAHHFGGHLSYDESVLPIGQRVYVLGQVGSDHDIRRPEIVDRPFIISHHSEDSLRNRALWGKRIWMAVVAILFIVGAGLLAAGFHVIERSPPRVVITPPGADNAALQRSAIEGKAWIA
jgi:hypothetical protein